ncbi:hypothetical protein V5N11_035787 [Cardamine amara subsp. amara]|uniref:Reverse transcriptase zinc-binding domain-containing protein n=1 Tax=Cardamine amara subsp. amara TaxID=228776 RepID=A0ABD1B5F0_CARAN
MWKFNAPPKVKIFWWKVIHNRLHVATPLKQRGVRIDPTCLLCGEDQESVNHLLFKCRIAKEIWDLAPVITPSDASWISTDQPACIVWKLHQRSGKCIIQGQSSIPPVSTPLETESIALRMAVHEMAKLRYRTVQFVGDCQYQRRDPGHL